ncbi:MAG: 3-oxoacyl-[acyl-carrier-protein] reductase [Deltaproteobacteria bacterium GWA2_38_16]|nr:MAG: 3-oxoacyl-[acyl-carrier-protein] reductase [Deltaproteobacteria bacterium GWA2_38_16]OGQ02578.1 MAG: 3-oxoacyl-[acyl-carrier-protein] reductase [Deltaproteobacteria bacterium RIFCSPHIGHO2_02_FULL_38_15]OGQ60405.1 MAG: 3-oxoacyl-[acyl-carrier-protein] reductase [Deltaproteobacteria bacterium RIFCSPLOWO2_12_FULL_38_8]HBQ20966.1 3-oxoacyl-[acyl-carrier-protein] reductase [Deltaproteobacteria bacterium]
MSFENKIALVTGASRGIGRSIALELAKAGATVCVNFQKNSEKAEGVLQELKHISSKPHCLSQFNTSSLEETEKEIAKCIAEHGKIDILVNNAGITKDGLLLRMKESDWDEVIATNLKGIFNCSKVVAKSMLKHRQGRIINITSYSGEAGNPGQSNYSASKAGVIGFTKSLAKELGSRSITVNAVSPGFIQTDMTSQIEGEYQKEVCKNIPLGFFGSCEDVAHLVTFLSSDDARYITGQVIGVNGGLYM